MVFARFSRMIFMTWQIPWGGTMSWAFSCGEEYKTSSKKLNNFDSGDGIIK